MGRSERSIRDRMNRLDWERELERLHPASFRWALACCSGDREEAREVLQTVYVKVLDGRARFGGEASPTTWLFSVIRRTAAGRRRTGLVRRVLLGRWARRSPDSPAVPDPHAGLEAAERRARLREALASISERQRQVLDLVFYHDLTIEQAAGVMGIGLGSARTHYERGKRSLLQRLTEEGQ
jgi:RNA polymerase sigma-70 factor (ECF subfamily)